MGQTFSARVRGVFAAHPSLDVRQLPYQERKSDAVPRLGLTLAEDTEFKFYTCSVRYIEGPLDKAYDWAADVLSDQRNPAAARKKLRAMPHALFCDALLDQAVFSGVGNIIKNEVLFRILLHPLSTVGALPAPKLRALVEQARQYSFDFLQWKRPMCSGIGSRIPKRFARAAISLQQGPPRQDQATKFLLRQLSGSLRFPATFTMSCAAQRTQHDKMSDYNPQGRVTG
jgi:hypothetical protein